MNRARVQRVRSWLTSVAIGGDSEAERSSERNRRVIASAFGGLGLRGSAFVVILVSVPLTLAALGPVRFGLWMTLVSVVAIVGATDFGIGNGVLNNIARAFGQGDSAAARRYLAAGFVATGGYALVFGAIFVLAYPFIPWASLYNVAGDATAAAEAGPATAAFVATFLLGQPLGLAAQVRGAYQEGFVQSVFAGIGNATTLALLVVAVTLGAGLPVLVLAMAAGPLIAGLANLFVLLRLQRPWLIPKRSDVTISGLRSVMGVGLGFMILQIAYTVAFSSDRLIVAHVLGPAAVADYSAVYRLFAIPTGLAVIAILPLWPAYREAIARSDLRWVRVTLRRSLFVVIAATVPLGIVLSFAGPATVNVWTQGRLDPASSLYPALAAFTVALAVANVFQVLLNGAQAMRFQISVWLVMAVLNIALGIYLASTIGVAGVAVGSVIAVTLVLIVPAIGYVPRLIRRLEHLEAEKVDAATRGEPRAACS